jgi:hypothetical protein
VKSKPCVQPLTDFGDAYLTLRSLAVYSGLGVRTLRNHLIDAGAPLPHYRVGGRILVRRSEYDVWAQRFRHAAPGKIEELVNDVMRNLK